MPYVFCLFGYTIEAFLRIQFSIQIYLRLLRTDQGSGQPHCDGFRIFRENEAYDIMIVPYISRMVALDSNM